MVARPVCCVAVALALSLAPSLVSAAGSDGKALYNSKCAGCHGQDGVPKKMGAGSKAFGDPAFKKDATADSIVKDVHEGKGKMKPIKNVTPEDATAIAQYILTIPAAK